MTVSDAKASALQDVSLAIGRAIDKQFRSWHDDHDWTDRLEKVLAKLPIKDLEQLKHLVETGPLARPDS